MVDVIREKCSITGKVIIGIGIDDFNTKWEAHIKSVRKDMESKEPVFVVEEKIIKEEPKKKIVKKEEKLIIKKKKK